MYLPPGSHVVPSEQKWENYTCLAWSAWPWQGISEAIVLLQLPARSCKAWQRGAEASLSSALLRQSPTDSGSCIGICFSSFLVWSKATGDFFPPWKNSSVWFEKGWGQEVAGKGCLIVFSVTWLLFCTCTRLPLVRTGASLGSQDGAVAEETSSIL